MKIVFVSPFFYPVQGGMENHVYHLADQLIKKGHEVEVFTSNLSRDGKIKEKEAQISGIKVKRFKAWFKLGQFASFFPAVFSAIKKSNADIIHVHNYRHPINLAPLLTKKPCLITLHWPEYPAGLRVRKMDIFARNFDRFLGPFLLKRYKRVCAVSQNEIAFIQNLGVSKERIVLIPNGIPQSFLAKEEKRSFRVKYGFKENDFIVLALSRIHKSKGFDKIIRLAEKFPHVKFVIAGKDEGFKKELEQLKEKLKVNNVFFIGEVSEEDKRKAFASCDLFIHPTKFEAFGIVVLEAMAQGKPIIASNVGGLSYVVSDAGILFQERDLKDLEDKFKRVLYSSALRKKLSEKAVERASKFTWEKIADNLERVYKEL